MEDHFSGEHDRNLLTRRVNTINCGYCGKKYDKSTYNIFLTYFFNQFISDSRIFFYLKSFKIRENCFRKKAPSWMFNWVLNTSLKTNQHSDLSFSVNAYLYFNLFFFAFHTPLIFNFRIISARSFEYGLGLPRQRKRNLSPLWFPCESNLGDYIFLWPPKYTEK